MKYGVRKSAVATLKSGIDRRNNNNSNNNINNKQHSIMEDLRKLCCPLFVFHAIAHDNSTLLLTLAVMGAPCSVCTIIYKHMYLHCKNNTANRSLHVCFHLSSLYNPINKSVMINCSCLLSSLFHAREDNQQYMTTLNQ